MKLRHAYRVLLIGLLIATLSSSAFAQGTDEAARLRVILVLDTDDAMGATWGQDGYNVKQVLEATLEKQKLMGRMSFEVFTGGQVNPDTILAHLRGIKVGPNETIVFYYSGHGGTHRTRGHFLALKHGNLFRSDILASIQMHKPRLTVLMTDCCRNFAAGAFQTEPPGSTSVIMGNNQPGKTPAARVEPPAASKQFGMVDPKRSIAPPRPEQFDAGPIGPAGPAAKVEPPSVSASLRGGDAGKPKARVEEPPSSTVTFKGGRGGLPLVVASGRFTLDAIAEKADGQIMRDLLFRHTGVVDLQSSQLGKFSYGSLKSGGSCFTNAFAVLQTRSAASFDKNGDNMVEWSEFFTPLQDLTSQIRHGGDRQTPDAVQLANPRR